MPLIGNKVTEKDIRDHLSLNKYYGRTAEFHELELHAIQRPGWIQIFRFHIRAKHVETGWQELFGVVRDDERNRTDIHLFEEEEERNELMAELSQDLICLEGNRERLSPVVLLAFPVFGFLLISVIVLLANIMK